MLPTPRALLFDLDATLLAAGNLPEAVARTCADLVAAYPVLDGEALAAANAAAFEAYWREVEADWTLGALSGEAIGLEVWRRALIACSVADEAIALRANQAFMAYAREGHCLSDDAASLLDALAGRFRLALITNGAPDSQREKLQCTDLEAVFDAILISGEVGLAKPDPGIFRLALEKLGVVAGEAWHIGDTPATDVAGARAAGITAVWLNRTGRARLPEETEADVEIRSLSDLVAHLGFQP